MVSIPKREETPTDQQDREDIEFLVKLFNDPGIDGGAKSSPRVETARPNGLIQVGSLKLFDQFNWPLTLKASFVDHYVFGDVIGTGSYAEVRESLNSLTLERCAVKIVNKSYLQKRVPQGLQNQLREIHVLRQLNHENIISMKECIFHSKHIYLVLEHCSCTIQELLDLKDDHILPDWQTQCYFIQLMNGIQYLHSHGIIHRDIKPQNLLINNDGVLKIIDYGVSCILSPGQKSDTCSNYEGSPLFQAPEVVSGQKSYGGFKVDIWSAGVTLYLMACGKYPFDDEALLGLYDRILAEELIVPTSVNDALGDLFQGILDKDCDQRLSIEQIKCHPWIRCTLVRPKRYDNVPILPPKPTGDIYRSMTILPYLYSHHYPKSKSPSRSPTPTTPFTLKTTSGISNLTPIDHPASNESSDSISTSVSSRSSLSDKYPQGSMVSSQDEGSIWNDSDETEWGTEEQYRQLKLPNIRVNRQAKVRRRDGQSSFWSRFTKLF